MVRNQNTLGVSRCLPKRAQQPLECCCHVTATNDSLSDFRCFADVHIDANASNSMDRVNLRGARTLWGRDGSGIGAVAVHPSQRFIAVAEKCPAGVATPNIYIYSFPELQLACPPLAGGTERAYSDVNFK